MNITLEDLRNQTGLDVGVCSSKLLKLNGLANFLTLPSAAYTRAISDTKHDLFIGWGHDPSGRLAIKLAEQSRRPYLLLEDAFLRSVAPESVGGENPIGLVIDDSGIYYESSEPSRLERLIAKSSTENDTRVSGQKLLDALKKYQVCKYNNFDCVENFNGLLDTNRQHVCVLDQTFNDHSVPGAGADAKSFKLMLEAAIDENPNAEIIVKLHPEVMAGQKQGYLKGLAEQYQCRLLSQNFNPWHLFSKIEKAYVVSSQAGFDALLAGVKVRCFGMPFYAGWGLTEDEMTCSRRASSSPTLQQMIHATHNEYASYLNPWNRAPSNAISTAENLVFLRNAFKSNDEIVGFYQVMHWKRKRVRSMFKPVNKAKSNAQHFFYREKAALKGLQKQPGALAAWSSRTKDDFLKRCSDASIPVYNLEDGFIRSVGLGTTFNQPMSLILDKQGIYYDSRYPSDLEVILKTHIFDEELLTRTKKLISSLIAQNITKYNLQNLSDKNTMLIDAGKKTKDHTCARPG